jgi:hypothetical protein
MVAGGWQIGYSYDAGTVWSSNGYVFAKDTKGVNHPLTSPNPKIYLPVGNCDVGDINARDCYSLAMMRSGGVIQMFGYTLPTFFGYMGWGIETYFGGQAGRLTLAESFFCNNQALVHELETTAHPVPEPARPHRHCADCRRDQCDACGYGFLCTAPLRRRARGRLDRDRDFRRRGAAARRDSVKSVAGTITSRYKEETPVIPPRRRDESE